MKGVQGITEGGNLLSAERCSSSRTASQSTSFLPRRETRAGASETIMPPPHWAASQPARLGSSAAEQDAELRPLLAEAQAEAEELAGALEAAHAEFLRLDAERGAMQRRIPAFKTAEVGSAAWLWLKL